MLRRRSSLPSSFLSLISCVNQVDVGALYSFIQIDKNIIFSINVKIVIINLDSRTTAINPTFDSTIIYKHTTFRSLLWKRIVRVF